MFKLQYIVNFEMKYMVQHNYKVTVVAMHAKCSHMVTESWLHVSPKYAVHDKLLSSHRHMALKICIKEAVLQLKKYSCAVHLVIAVYVLFY